MLKEQQTDTDVLYHVFVDKTISNRQQFVNLLSSLIGAYLAWREKRLALTMRAHGFSLARIAPTWGASPMTISNLLRTPSSIKLTDSSPSLATSDKRDNASVPLSVNEGVDTERSI